MRWVGSIDAFLLGLAEILGEVWREPGTFEWRPCRLAERGYISCVLAATANSRCRPVVPGKLITFGGIDISIVHLIEAYCSKFSGFTGFGRYSIILKN